MLNFLKYKTFYFLLSLLFLLPGIYSLLRFGLNPSLDFTGGSLIEISFTSPVAIDQLSQATDQLLSQATIQSAGEQTFIIRSSVIDQAANTALQTQLQSQFGPLSEHRFETVGPTLGRELIIKTLAGIAIASGFILLYVASRFHDAKYGICAILAMLHDTFILLGAFSILGQLKGVEVDSLFVTAVLSILSFSVHDTIVVYDRIRETLKADTKANFTTVVNRSITQTLGRSLNNSLTIIFMLLALFLLGGESIRWFVMALLIGTISGTYSSTFTAAPLLVVLENRKK